VRALTVRPGQAGSAKVLEMDEPPESDGSVLVETLGVGVCGTDIEIPGGEYGESPPGSDVLVLGHESLGRVVSAPAGSDLSAGDLVVGIVRRPDPVPCPNCAVGEWDMCRNGKYTEHGIKGLHGFAREHYRADPDALVRIHRGLSSVGMLLEPTTIVAKAWEHIERIGNRSRWQPQTAAVTGAGPVGLLAALLGVQRGLDVHVFDIVTTGPKPALVHDLGATYHAGSLIDAELVADIVLECTGVPEVVIDAMTCNGIDAIVCLTGVSSVGRKLPLDVGGLNRETVLQNDVIFGTVNANRRHYEQGGEALARADRDWLERLVTRRVPLERYEDALHRDKDDVKVVLEVSR
jgi:glucose 1-dehydrogenase